MTPTPEQLETAITKNIIKTLNRIKGVYVRKTFGSGSSGAGWPDIVGVILQDDGIGRFIALEVKRPSKRRNVTPLQQHELNKYKTRGAIAEVVTSPKEAIAAILQNEGTHTP